MFRKLMLNETRHSNPDCTRLTHDGPCTTIDDLAEAHYDEMFELAFGGCENLRDDSDPQGCPGPFCHNNGGNKPRCPACSNRCPGCGCGEPHEQYCQACEDAIQRDPAVA